jgi:hypothetical protein
LDGTLRVITFAPTEENRFDPHRVLAENRQRVSGTLQRELEARRGLKWYLCLQVQFIKYRYDVNDSGDHTLRVYRRNTCMTALPADDLSADVQTAFDQLNKSILDFQREGSGWVVDFVVNLELYVATYKPIRGGTYIPLPKNLADKAAIVNPLNDDQKCFVWAVLAGLSDVTVHPERMSHYRGREADIDLGDLDMPMPVDANKYRRFERLNDVGVNVFGYEKSVYPLYVTSRRDEDRHVDLLFLTRGQKRHYCCIKHLDRLLSDTTAHNCRRYHCRYCLHGYSSQRLLRDHLPYCQPHGCQRTVMPDDRWLKFKAVHKQLKVPYVIYADFESCLRKLEPETSGHSRTQKTARHEACGFAYFVVGGPAAARREVTFYRGEDSVVKFLRELRKEERIILDQLALIEPLQMTPADWRLFYSSAQCHICQRPFTGFDRPVKDHCHVTGCFRGAAHNACNLNLRRSTSIPVIIHNLRGYDSHLIMQEIGKFKDSRLSCIPNTMEKYISFKLGQLVFIDSYQFLPQSLGKLVANLVADPLHGFPYLRGRFDDDVQRDLMLRKGVYPYSYVDHPDRFSETSLPPREEFYNDLTGEHVSETDYLHAQNVWTTFGLQDLGQYHDLYVVSDTILLAEVFEAFRTLCLDYYRLDPAHYYTSPGMSWDAMLKLTSVELELFTDVDMYLFCERGVRGGICSISTRYGKANNPYLDHYDASEPTKYIAYLDQNNLYGHAMAMALPEKGFYWLDEARIEALDVTRVDDEAREGYILEVDLDYPTHLHNLHNAYPLAAEAVTITPDMLSPYSISMADKMNVVVEQNVRKLVPNLRDKRNYVLHYRNLKLYLSLGMKLVKVHRALAFVQSPWLRPYIVFNTEKRKLARNDFEKDFFKLLNNSVFGKTLENIRKHVSVDLVHKPDRLKKVIAKPNVKAFRIFSPDLAAVHLGKTKLVLNKPVYVGLSVLDLSKASMYEFHYLYVMAQYGPERAKLLFTDTDSLCYEINTGDLYADMRLHATHFDFSEYPRDHFLYDDVNKKVLGKMKDETRGVPPREFIGLRPKMYSLLVGDTAKKTAKGVSKSVVKQQVNHMHYYQCLFRREYMVHQMHTIRSEAHELYTMTVNKVSLSPYDDKRYILANGFDTLAYGHYKIPQQRRRGQTDEGGEPRPGPSTE